MKYPRSGRGPILIRHRKDSDMTDITKGIVLDKLVELVVQLPEGTITSLPEMMDLLFNMVDHSEEKGDKYDKGGLSFYVREDDYFEIDYDLFFRAREKGFYLDDSPFIDTVMALGYNNKFIVRKGVERPEKDLTFDISKLL